MRLKIKELRTEKGITQKQLANAINSTDKNIWAYENEIALPTIETIAKLADYFEVSTDYLLGREADTGIIQTNANLAPIEENILILLRKLSKADQYKVLGYVQALASW